MGFENIFEINRKFNSNTLKRKYPEIKGFSNYSRSFFNELADNLKRVSSFKNLSSKKQKLLILFAGLMIVKIIIVMIVVLIPLIIKGNN